MAFNRKFKTADMKILRKLMNLLAVGILFVAFNTCTQDNPVIEKTVWLGPTDNGNLQIFVRYFNTYFGAATVQIFKTKADRDAGNVFMETATTDHGSGPTGYYANFYNLPYARYYLKATYNDTGTGDFYVGTEDAGNGVWVPKGTTTSVHIMTSK